MPLLLGRGVARLVLFGRSRSSSRIVSCLLVSGHMIEYSLSGILDLLSMDKEDGLEEGRGTEVIEKRVEEGWISGLCRRVFHLLGGSKRGREGEEVEGDGRKRRRTCSGEVGASEGEALQTVEDGGIGETGSIEVNEEYLECNEVNEKYLECNEVNEEYLNCSEENGEYLNCSEENGEYLLCCEGKERKVRCYSGFNRIVVILLNVYQSA